MNCYACGESYEENSDLISQQAKALENGDKPQGGEK